MGQASAAFNRPDASLIFHLKNHYALIYGARVDFERQARPPAALRAASGNAPRAWVDWLEARETILGWAGYKRGGGAAFAFLVVGGVPSCIATACKRS